MSKNNDTSHAFAVYRGLREMALKSTPTELGIDVEKLPGPLYGVVMDFTVSDVLGTLVAFVGGEASLYLSSGGGVVGGGAHETVREAAFGLVMNTNEHVGKMRRVEGFPPPKTGEVVFYGLTKTGVLTVTEAEEKLVDRASDVWPIYYSAQELISELREVAVKGRGR
ncbi:MAG: hypothetical protein A2X32_09000 [Elusimicrobia bacterium GWC2_64_44]|nr:MAG: hypothetical protein A2X32_09000 [Elusimicrobia bacterium GWC2_64_44]